MIYYLLRISPLTWKIELKHYISSKMLIKLYYILINPHLFYGILVWGANFLTYIKKILTFLTFLTYIKKSFLFKIKLLD